MKSNIINVVIFAAGAAIGSAVTWKVIKNKYELMTQEDIDSLKGIYSKRSRGEELKSELEEAIEAAEEAANFTTEDLEEYEDYAAEYSTESEHVEEVQYVDEPYIIPSEEFGDAYDYEHIYLSYYADGVLADDTDEIVEDIEDTVGFDAVNWIKEHEKEDSVYVRNDSRRCEYEICRDLRTYTEVRGEEAPEPDNTEE